jgi:hypothetical protein
VQSTLSTKIVPIDSTFCKAIGAAMVDETAEQERSNWWLLLYVALGATAVYIPILMSAGFDLIGFFYVLVALPMLTLILGLVLLVFAFRKGRTPKLSVFLAFPVYWAVSWILFLNSESVRFPARWLLGSREYKAQVLAQPDAASGELRHIEWDGWGFAGSDTAVYLVYDPNDSLVPAANHAPGRFIGIPCEVPAVRRLESHWYSVVFYTGTSWDHC